MEIYSNEKIMRTPVTDEYLYSKLEPEYKCEVCTVLYNLIEDKNVLWKKLVTKSVVNSQDGLDVIAERIYSYMMMANVYLENDDLIKNKKEIQRLVKDYVGAKKNPPKEDDIIYELLCGYLNLSRDVLELGKGIHYELDAEKLVSLIKEDKIFANKDVKKALHNYVRDIVNNEFLMNVSMAIYKEFQIQKINNQGNAEIEKEKKNVDECIEFILHNQKLLAELSARALNIEVKEILIEKECSILLSTDDFFKLYNELKDEPKEVISILLANLYHYNLSYRISQI